MSDNAGAATRDTLVHRYADRIQGQTAMPVTITRVRRPSCGIQTFGRTPITRSRTGSTRSRRAITTLVATAILASSTPALTHASDSSYVIQSGDTLGQIAANHGVSVEDLIGWNGIENPDRIFAGHELIVSSNGSASGDNSDDDVQVGDTVYEIQSGDTLSGIAVAHGVSLADLLAINDIENPDQIFVGDFLIIPTSASGNSGSDNGSSNPDTGNTGEQAAPAEPAFDNGFDGDQSHIVGLHLVARGETPGGIALLYGISVNQLMQANGLSEGDMIIAGEMLRIPNASWEPSSSSSGATSPGSSVDVPEQSATAMLETMPVQQQSLSLSAESAALSMATNYWGHQVSEWVFIENMPYHPNPHRGFRGDMNGAFGGTADYGAYAKPLSSLVSNYGFVGEEFYTMGDPAELRDRIDNGQPVLVWMTNQATPQERFYEWYQGERFTLVPGQTVVVAYGYDEDNIYVADPGNGQYASYSWSAFIDSWSLFDGMSMAVYPAG